MENATREKILEAALESFAEKGYRGTNLRDLAAGMGLSKSALYKHYESKEDIWDALIGQMEAYYSEHFGSENHLPPVPGNAEELKILTFRMLDFTMHDKRIILTRKLLLTEQFRDARVTKLATRHFLKDTGNIFKRIFEQMMENGLMKREDPDLVAFLFTSPITAMIHYCDREPEKEPEIMGQIEAFLTHFIQMYGIR